MPLHVLSTMCSSSGGQNCIIQHLVSSHTPVGGCPVHRLREESSLNLCTGQPPTGVMIPDVYNLLMMSILCLKHVEAYNKCIIKQEFVH